MPVYSLGQGALYELDLIIAQGATNTFTMRYKAGDPPVPVDLTGWTARAQVRRSHDSASVWLDLTPTMDANGYVTVLIPYAATEGILWDDRETGVWDLEITSPAGKRTRLVQGRVVISPEVTRA